MFLFLLSVEDQRSQDRENFSVPEIIAHEDVVVNSQQIPTTDIGKCE